MKMTQMDTNTSAFLIAVAALNGLCGVGFGFGTASVLAAEYRRLFPESDHTDLIGSLLTGSFLFSGKWMVHMNYYTD